MLRILRKLNLLLVLIVGWQVTMLFYAQPVSGQATPFLYRPYYGNFVGVSSSFDHSFPNYGIGAPRIFVKWNGGTITEPPNDISVIDGDACSVDGWSCYDGHPGYDLLLSYAPVVASSSGAIFYAGWESTNHDLGLGLKVEIDHANFYRTIYGHLSMVRYQTGESVGQWQIGTSGVSGNVTGPHLHFEVKRNYGGSYRRTDPYGWRDRYNNNDNSDDPWFNDTTNGVASTYLWVDNPLQVAPTYSNEITVDDGDGGFNTYCLSGNYWWTENNVTAAHNSDLRYTHPNGDSTNCYATWQINFPSTGVYEVRVHIPSWAQESRTHAARYTIYYADSVDPTIKRTKTLVVDQHRIGYLGKDANDHNVWSTTGQWLSLGRYNFRQGTNANGYVRLVDAAYIGTHSENTASLNILFDAVRWAY